MHGVDERIRRGHLDALDIVELSTAQREDHARPSLYIHAGSQLGYMFLIRYCHGLAQAKRICPVFILRSRV